MLGVRLIAIGSKKTKVKDVAQYIVSLNWNWTGYIIRSLDNWRICKVTEGEKTRTENHKSTLADCNHLLQNRIYKHRQ